MTICTKKKTPYPLKLQTCDFKKGKVLEIWVTFQFS